MKRTRIFLVLLSLFPSASSMGSPLRNVIPADDPRIQYSGRVDWTDPQTPKFDWPGISITVKFKGESVGFLLDDGGNNYNLTLDGKAVTVWATEKGRQEYVLDHLKKGEHLAVLSKRTEGSFGVAAFKGVLLSKTGELLAAPPQPSRRIEFLGASWVCGYGNEGNSIKCPDLRHLENNDLSFGPLAAKILGAEYHVTAYSGRGIVRNYGDAKAESAEPFGAFFDRTLMNSAKPAWNFSQWVPDVVVINLGLNDYSTEPQPNPKLFNTRTVELLARVRTVYPNAWIVCYNATGWPFFIQHVHDAVADYKKRGDAKVMSLEFGPYPPEEHACDYHPNLKAHRRLAEDLASRISKLWSDEAPTPTPPAYSTPDGVWAPGVKHEAFRYEFKGPLDEAVWERAQYSMDDVGSYIKPSEARDGAEFLTMFVNRLTEPVGKHRFTGGGLMSRSFYGYGRYTVRMKSNIKSGTVSSFFLMNKWEPGRWFHKEIDIEFLGKDPKTVQFVTHRYFSDQGPEAMGQPYIYSLPFGYGDGFHDYSIEWTREKVSWSVDGKKIWETAQNIPDVPLAILMNHWGPDPGAAWSASWVGAMDLNALPSKAEYQWVKYEPE